MEAIIKGNWTRDGAGVKLYRVFGSPELVELMDPFLLLDHFGSRYPHEYLMGFPWHPHRGIETVTYLLKGEVHHRDSTGVSGILREGDIQWMTAGSGIFHEEMPKPGRRIINKTIIEDPEVSGFQLWVNLPRVSKMSKPKYRNVNRGSVPKVTLDNGVEVTLITGRVKAPGYGIIEGPINDLTTPVNYIDVSMPGNSTFNYEVKEGYRALIYVINGSLIPGNERNPVTSGQLVVYSRDGGEINVRTMGKSARFLLLAGKPIGEPVAWYGPIVMNTWDELEKAFTELREGAFIKHEPEVNDID